MKKFVLAVMLFAFGFSTGAVLAEETHYDPMARNLIFVEGKAETTIPVNGFSLTFGFDIEKGSFADASSYSNGIVDRISAGVKALNLTSIEIIKGWDIVKRAKISIGAKGKKISNVLTVRVLDYPQGKLHELIAAIIDKSLAVDPAIALENIKVFVSEDIENKKKEELVDEALKALKSNASRAAEAVGRKLSAPKRIYISSEQDVYKSEESYDRLYPSYEMPASPPIKRAISIQKSFNVSAEIVDHMKMSATVFGVYEIE